MKKPIICIITGPSGAGKSTISKELSRQFPRSAYIDVDELRDMLGKYCANFSSYSKEAKTQIKLSMDNAIAVGINFLKKGYNIFVDDVLEEKMQISYYSKKLRGNKVFFFLLLPKKQILKRRDQSRGKDAMHERAIELHDIFSKIKNDKRWHVIDNSRHNIKKTVNEISKIIKNI